MLQLVCAARARLTTFNNNCRGNCRRARPYFIWWFLLYSWGGSEYVTYILNEITGDSLGHPDRDTIRYLRHTHPIVYIRKRCCKYCTNGCRANYRSGHVTLMENLLLLVSSVSDLVSIAPQKFGFAAGNSEDKMQSLLRFFAGILSVIQVKLKNCNLLIQHCISKSLFSDDFSFQILLLKTFI